MDEGEERRLQLVLTGGNTAKPFDFLEKHSIK